ncbi:MAG TPA: TonB-dependent receptor plug domain-containing protein [Gemmatimonadaceae bacterium]|nr:TonB-dependent receptor plug domain-containing protein [Gemmatimonadaceae bacterium]
MRTRQPPLSTWLLGAAVLVAASDQLAAQQLHIVMLDPGTGRPIPLVAVNLVPDSGGSASAAVKSGNDGVATVRAPAPGVYRLHAILPDHREAKSPAIDLKPGDELSISWRPKTDTARLSPVRVTASNRNTSPRLNGFQERQQRHAFGTFITRDVIEQRKPTRVSDVLSTVPGLIVTPSARGFGSDVQTTEGCRPAVYVDGLRYPLLRGETIDDVVDPTALEGIEVYAHAAEVPVEFQGPWSNCGAIVLWTRGA